MTNEKERKMIESESMIENIKWNLKQTEMTVDDTTLNIILITIEEQVNQPGHIYVEGEWSVCPPEIVTKVKEVLG